jgi:hypothetical protein
MVTIVNGLVGLAVKRQKAGRTPWDKMPSSKILSTSSVKGRGIISSRKTSDSVGKPFQSLGR